MLAPHVIEQIGGSGSAAGELDVAGIVDLEVKIVGPALERSAIGESGFWPAIELLLDLGLPVLEFPAFGVQFRCQGQILEGIGGVGVA